MTEPQATNPPSDTKPERLVSVILRRNLIASLIAEGTDPADAETIADEVVAFARERAAQLRAQRDPEVRHLGRKANAEDCPACLVESRNLPYPFLCPENEGAPRRASTEEDNHG